MKSFSAPLEFDVHFFLTTFCNAFCRHCLMSAGPHQPKNFMKLKDVLFYLDELGKDPNFNGGVGFNGGEVMTAYKEYSPTYIPKILQECINRNYRIDIRTNSLWASDEKINHIIWDSLTNLDFSKYTEKINFSLSVDKFHANEEANAKLISKICHYDLADTGYPTNLNLLRDRCTFSAYVIPDNYKENANETTYARLYSSLVDLRDMYNVELGQMSKNSIPERYSAGAYLNGIPLLIECHALGQWGRAKDFGIGNISAEERIFSSFDIIHKNSNANLDRNSCVKTNNGKFHLIFFPSENGGTADFIPPVEKVTPGVPYHIGNKCKPWSQLYPEMVANLQTRFNELKKEFPQITEESVELPNLLRTLGAKQM